MLCFTGEFGVHALVSAGILSGAEGTDYSGSWV